MTSTQLFNKLLSYQKDSIDKTVFDTEFSEYKDTGLFKLLMKKEYTTFTKKQIKECIMKIKAISTSKKIKESLNADEKKDDNDIDNLTSFMSNLNINEHINKNERINRLKEHLQSSKNKHDDLILKENTLKNAHIYCIIHNVSAQQYGPLLEKYIITKYNYKKNNASNCTGDCSKDEENIEIKASLGGITHTKFNYVQIRLGQNITSYLLTAYHLTNSNVEDEGMLYIFKIPKTDIKKIIMSYGGYAHGTVKEHGQITLESLNDDGNKKEYALRPLFNDACWNELMKFRIDEKDI